MKLKKLEKISEEQMNDTDLLEAYASMANMAKDYINTPLNNTGVFTETYNHSIENMQKILNKYKQDSSKEGGIVNLTA